MIYRIKQREKYINIVLRECGMKKIICSLFCLFIASTVFADYMFEVNMSSLSVADTFEHYGCNTISPDENTIGFTPLCGFGIKNLWLFNQKEGNDFQLLTGLDTHYYILGVAIDGVFGINKVLGSTANGRNIELNTSFKIGPLIDLFGGVNFHFGCDVDALFFMDGIRNKNYLGVGLAFDDISSLIIYKKYGADFFTINTLALHFTVGYRFQ